MDESLLIRFLSHTASDEDLRVIEQWISVNKKNADWLFEMERVWSLKDELKYADHKKINEAYESFISKIPIGDKQERYIFNLSWYRSSMKYAAVVVCTLILSFGMFKLMLSEEPIAQEYNQIEVPNGQRVSLILSDGTKVWLNCQSKLTYPASFTGNKRKVQLEGEGFFEVAHNSEKPFIVDGELLDVKVLGTKFNFRSYKNEDATVTLSEGKVEVSTYDGQDNLTLKPLEQVVYSSKNGITLNKNVDTNLLESWTAGETVFHDQPLYLICKDLERKFDVAIEITDAQLANELFTCRFKEGLNIQQVLNLLKATKQLNYIVNESEVIIKNR